MNTRVPSCAEQSATVRKVRLTIRSMSPSVRVINSCGQVVLTPREEQTVNLVTMGMKNREIATELKVRENSVKKSLLRIYDKLGVSNRVELVLYALSHSQQRSSESLQEEQAA